MSAGGALQGGAAGGGGATKIVYVSTTGSDASDGLSALAPKATLAAGIAAAVAIGDAEVWVARGAYVLSKTLEVAVPVVVRGSYAPDFQTAWPGASAAALCDDQVDASQLTRISAPGVSPVVRITAPTGAFSGLDVSGEVVGVRLEQSGFALSDGRVSIEAASAAQPTKAIQVAGGAPDLSRLCVRGGPGTLTAAPGFASAGIHFTGNAKGTLSQSRVQGGSGDGAMDGGSVGVLVENGSPEIAGNDLRGGSGASSYANGFASVGVLLLSTSTPSALKMAPRVHDNTLSGGSGINTTSVGFGSTGLAVTSGENPVGPGIALVGPAAVRANTIHGGTGRNKGDGRSGTIGVYVYGGSMFPELFDLELSENDVVGGAGAEGQSVRPTGVMLELARGTVSRNTIVAGTGYLGGATGISLRNTADVDVTSNMVHSGSQDGGAWTVTGLTIETSPRVRIRHNTFHLGVNAPLAQGMNVVADTSPFSPTSHLRIENNLFLGGEPGAKNEGVVFVACPVGILEAFQGNGFANLGGSAVRVGLAGPSCLGDPTFGVADFVPAMTAVCGTVDCGMLTGALKGNVDLRPACATASPECVAVPGCSTLDGCGAALFQTWDAADHGLGTLKAEHGWKLRGDLPCAVSQSPIFLPSTGADRFGNTRTPPASRGAHEQDLCQ